MKRIIHFFLLLLLAGNLKALPETSHLNFNPISSVTGKSIIFDSDRRTNPALIAKTETNFATIIYSPSVFNLPELSPALLFAGNKITDDLKLALSIYNLGNSKYSDFSATIHSGVNISSILDAGISVSYVRQSIQNYNNTSSFDLNLGFILKLSDIFNAGFNYSYINNPYPDQANALYNHLVNIGFGATINEELAIEIASKLLINYQTGFIFSGRYSIGDYLLIGLGFSTNPSITGLSVKIIPIDLLSISGGFNYNSLLGFSKSIAVSFYW